MKQKTIEELNKVDFLAITTDGWSSQYQKGAFISLTLHYLNELFEQVNISLGIIPANYSHNAGNLKNHLLEILSGLGVEKKVKVMIVDHASTMGALCASMDVDFYGSFAHFMNLVCHLFLVCVKNPKFTTENFSDDEDATLSEDDDDAWEDLESESSAEAQEKIIRGDVPIDPTFLHVLEEETEEEIYAEEKGFNGQDFQEIAIMVVTVVKKIKKIITTFNMSNDLTRELLEEQKDSLTQQIFEKESHLADESCHKTILQLIQDVITR